MAELQSRLDAVVHDAVARDIVGAVVLISRSGTPVYARAAGWADREAGIAMRIDSLFRLASVSKVIVSAATMVLVGQGQLDFGDDVRRWLPWFAPTLAGGERPAITSRHLLSHMAGLSHRCMEPHGGAYARADVSVGFDRAPVSLTENMHRLASAPLRYRPGDAWGYSLSIDVLGAVIERVMDTPLPAAIRSLVTAPLAMHDTDFIAVDPGRLTAAYVRADPPRRLREPDWLPVAEGLADLSIDRARALDSGAYPSAGSGMIASASDVMRLLESLRRAELLDRSLVEAMARDQTGGAAMPGWNGWGHGLGFAVLRDPAAADTPESVGTWRWGRAYGHSRFVDRARDASVVILTNAAVAGLAEPDRFAIVIRDVVCASTVQGVR